MIWRDALLDSSSRRRRSSYGGSEPQTRDSAKNAAEIRRIASKRKCDSLCLLRCSEHPDFGLTTGEGDQLGDLELSGVEFDFVALTDTVCGRMIALQKVAVLHDFDMGFDLTDLKLDSHDPAPDSAGKNPNLRTTAPPCS